MLSPFICGSFHHQEEEDDQSPCSSPKRSSRKSSKEKNPYATRGLDKFSALLADLERKRQKIYSQNGSQDISFVRFVYSGSNDCVPIIVKTKDQNKAGVNKDETKEKKITMDNNAETLDKSKMGSSSSTVNQENKQSEKKRVSSIWDLKLSKLRRPSVYMPVFVILILLFLAFFGRSVAILCTSIGWYLVPTLCSKPDKPAKKKKQLMRRYSEISPRTKNVGDAKDESNHGRQNSF